MNRRKEVVKQSIEKLNTMVEELIAENLALKEENSSIRKELEIANNRIENVCNDLEELRDGIKSESILSFAGVLEKLNEILYLSKK